MIKTFVLTAMALVAFASNSVLCRIALKNSEIDAASFTAVRLISGAACLLLLMQLRQRKAEASHRRSWRNALYLFVYAAAFSFAYLDLNTGAGALILFGSVQVTMVVMAIIHGQRLAHREWLGLVVAFLGLVFLLLPGAESPSLMGFILMVLSGVAWGFYSLAGQSMKDPLAVTTTSFMLAIPLVCVLVLACVGSLGMTLYGFGLAILSGAVMSGLGYALWYAALVRLTVMHAAVVQLFVPIIAAIGGVLFAAETVSLQLLASTAMVSAGVLLVILGRSKTTQAPVFGKGRSF